MKKNAFVIGCNSERGKAICDLINNSDDFEFRKGIGYDNREKPNVAVSTILTKPSDLKLYDSCIAKKDVIIDVSNPKATMDILPFATKHRIPMVIGITGFTSGQEIFINVASHTIPIFMLDDVAIRSDISTVLDAARFIIRNTGPRIYKMYDMFTE